MRELILAVLLFLMGGVFAVKSPEFATASNLLDTTRYSVEIGLLSLPMTLIIIGGGIDLSVGSATALCVVAFGALWKHGLALPVAALLAILLGAFLGGVNGAAVTLARIPPLITTLATLAFYRGVASGLGGGAAVQGFPDSFTYWGTGYLFEFRSFQGVPAQLPIFVAFAIVFAVVLSKTAFGRTVYALGSNEEAARLAGIGVQRLKVILYTMSGAMCGVASIVLIARSSRAKAEGSAEGYELDAIAAVVLGGTNIAGGEGGIAGTVLGLLIIRTLRNGLAMMGGTSFPSEVQSVIIGVVLILTVWVDQWLRPLLMRYRDARMQRRQDVRASPR